MTDHAATTVTKPDARNMTKLATVSARLHTQIATAIAKSCGHL
jgi:hypothetical protein